MCLRRYQRTKDGKRHIYLAERGYSRDHRADCQQVVLALVVTPDGFPLYHQVFAGNTNDAVAFPEIVNTMESRLGRARRVWVPAANSVVPKSGRFVGVNSSVGTAT